MLPKVVAIISGGASGLGAATASVLLRKGARVLVADLPQQKESFLRLASTGGAAAGAAVSGVHLDDSVLAFAETDVTDESQVSKALNLAEETFGEPVNAAINCAGIAIAKKTLSKSRKDGSLFPHALDEFSKVLQINTIGSFNLARLAAQRMAAREAEEDGLRGCIVNTASVAAYDGQIGQVAYSASKGAVVGMTLPMARELSRFGVRVVTVAPGLFRTPLLETLPEEIQEELGRQVPLPSRLGNPEEFGELVASILGNSYLNGEVIRLDGALRMPP